MTTILLIVAGTLTLSFLCSLLEAVLLTATHTYIGVLVKERKKSALLFEHLKSNIDRPISAILVLNTLAHTLGSAAIAYRVQLQYGEHSVTIASFILTFLILIIAEIIPKSLGAAHWKALIPFTAYTIQALIIVLFPIVIFSEKLGRIFSPTSEAPDVTREEILVTAELGVEEGTIKNKESAIIKNLLMLDKMYVSDIMTPRSVFFALEESETVESIFNKHKPLRFSRIPIYKDNLDNIVGMTFRYRIHEALSNDDRDKPVGEMIRPISTVAERMTVSLLLDFFIKEKEHVALAVDDYGIVTGLVSLEDAVETLLGVEIVDELDSVPDMRRFALEQWQQRKQKMRKT